MSGVADFYNFILFFSVTGDYYLQTTEASPYSMGMEGLTYSNAQIIETKLTALMSVVILVFTILR
jgi:hypothetical protein